MEEYKTCSKCGRTLEVTKNFEGAVIYETSDSAVATVSTSGLITKKANGKATITAKCKNKSVSCEVVDLITNDSWVLQSLNIPYLHSRGITGKGVKVAVIDSRVSSIPNKLTIAKTVSFCTLRFQSWGEYALQAQLPHIRSRCLHNAHFAPR